MTRNIINTLIILISLSSFSQTKIDGTFFKKGRFNDFKVSYKFKDSIFEYEHSGDVGVIEYGNGTYYIEKDSLYLKYNLTTSKNKSNYKILKSNPTTKDSIKLRLIIRNHYTLLEYPLNGSIKINNDDYLKLNDKGTLTLKKSQDSIKLKTGNLHHDSLTFKIKADKDYTIEILLSEFSGKPIYNTIEKFKINKITPDSIQVEKYNKRILLLKTQ